jgi:hypothetical protein
MPNFYNLLRARKFSTAADTALEIAPYDSATPNFAIEAGGRLKWSSGSANADTTLYRSAANTLKTDDSFDVASGHTYKIDGADVLTATSLGSSVVNSSLTSLGTLSSLNVDYSLEEEETVINHTIEMGSVNDSGGIKINQEFLGEATITSSVDIDSSGLVISNSLSDYELSISTNAIIYSIPEDPTPRSRMQSNDIFSPSISSNSLTVNGTMSFQQTTEKVNTSSISSNIMTCDYTTGAIYYQSTNPSANFTVNFTNVPTTDDKAITFTIFVTQGATGYIPSTLQIDGSAQTIKWAQGTQPTPTANKIDIFSFTLIRLSSSWTVFGNANTNF